MKTHHIQPKIPGHKYTRGELESFMLGLLEGDGSIQVNHWKKRYLQYRIIIKLNYSEANYTMLQSIRDGLQLFSLHIRDKNVLLIEDDKEKIRKIMHIIDHHGLLLYYARTRYAFFKYCFLQNIKYSEYEYLKKQGSRVVENVLKSALAEIRVDSGEIGVGSSLIRVDSFGFAGVNADFAREANTDQAKGVNADQASSVLEPTPISLEEPTRMKSTSDIEEHPMGELPKTKDGPKRNSRFYITNPTGEKILPYKGNEFLRFPGLYSWLCGFMEAEACFSIRRGGTYSFSISQKHEVNILNVIKTFFEIPNRVRFLSSSECYLLETYNRRSLNRVLHFVHPSHEETSLLGEFQKGVKSSSPQSPIGLLGEKRRQKEDFIQFLKTKDIKNSAKNKLDPR